MLGWVHVEDASQSQSSKYNKKGRKTAEKNVSTSFRVLQAPESWSKYTTYLTVKAGDL